MNDQSSDAPQKSLLRNVFEAFAHALGKTLGYMLAYVCGGMIFGAVASFSYDLPFMISIAIGGVLGLMLAAVMENFFG